MTKKISLAAEVAKRAEDRYPDYEITIEVPGEKAVDLIFRNQVNMSREERKAYNRAAIELQDDIKAAAEKAKKADEEGDEKAMDDLLDMDGVDMYIDMMRRQLTVQASNTEKAKKVLAKLDARYIGALHSICTDGIDSPE